jgi:hypothetical protein
MKAIGATLLGLAVAVHAQQPLYAQCTSISYPFKGMDYH